MERYVEISLAELFDLISKKETTELYFKTNDVIQKINSYTFNLTRLHDKKWFKREVIE